MKVYRLEISNIDQVLRGSYGCIVQTTSSVLYVVRQLRLRTLTIFLSSNALLPERDNNRDITHHGLNKRKHQPIEADILDTRTSHIGHLRYHTVKKLGNVREDS